MILNRSPRRAAVLGTALAILALVLAGLYGTLRFLGNPDGAGCEPGNARLAALRPLARGEVAAFQVGERAVPAPPLGFKAPDGAGRTLADFRGRTVLLNLWATWCLPCKQEMPALDRLQAELGGPDFEVVAVNIDTREAARPRAWLGGAGIRNLAYYADPEAKIFQDLRKTGDAEGMPTTLLIDRDGCRLGRLAGGADWASPDALTLIRTSLGVRN